MSRTSVGRAPIVRRRTPTFPTRMASYFDLTQWQGGFLRITGAPGAARLPGGNMVDLRTGEVFADAALQAVLASCGE